MIMIVVPLGSAKFANTHQIQQGKTMRKVIKGAVLAASLVVASGAVAEEQAGHFKVWRRLIYKRQWLTSLSTTIV